MPSRRVSARSTRSRTVRIAALALAASALTGCTQTISMQPAPGANDPLCAAVMVRLPAAIANESREGTATAGEGFERTLERVWTDAQATAAWGSGGAVKLVCGVPDPGPVALPCSSWGGIDWLVDSSDLTNTRMITYGRSPATQVEFDPSRAQGAAVWDALASSLNEIPATKTCDVSG